MDLRGDADASDVGIAGEVAGDGAGGSALDDSRSAEEPLRAELLRGQRGAFDPRSDLREGGLS